MKFIAAKDFVCDKSVTCCITGHRSRDLPFCGDMRKEGMRRFSSVLSLMCEETYREGYRTFISGMSDGIDLICAKIIFEMIALGRYPGARLVCALPYIEQVDEIKAVIERYYYSMILDCCDDCVVVSTKSNKQKYKLRNQFMVDHSSLLIGAYKQKLRGSGTLQTINMAEKAGIRKRIISLDTNPIFFDD